MTLLLGKYTVERSERGDYLLTGARGAAYGLFRNVSNPDHLFPVALGGGHLPVILRGRWFTDEGGTLRPLR